MNAVATSAADHLRSWFIVNCLMLGSVFVPMGIAMGYQSAYRYGVAMLKQPTRTEQLVRTMESYADEDTEFDVTARPKKYARK